MAVERNLVNEFFARVSIGSLADCWNWAGTISTGGYGRIHLRPKVLIAHRFSYELFKGGIPDGLFVCHRCDNPKCVNPDHLYAGTPKQNSADRDARGRANTAHGEKHYRAKISDEDVRFIRSSEASISELADMFGVGSPVISNIQLGRTRASARGRIRGRKDTHRKSNTACANGHEITKESTYTYPSNGKTYCRVCGAESARIRKARIREERRKAKGVTQ